MAERHPWHDGAHLNHFAPDVPIGRYRSHPDCAAFVYDPDQRIVDTLTLEADLSETRWSCRACRCRPIAVQLTLGADAD